MEAGKVTNYERYLTHCQEQGIKKPMGPTEYTAWESRKMQEIIAVVLKKYQDGK